MVPARLALDVIPECDSDNIPLETIPFSLFFQRTNEKVFRVSSVIQLEYIIKSSQYYMQ